MNILSLFSGIGGLELGLERAGMTVVGQVEIDPFCQRVLAKHWPEVPRHDDVRTAVEWWRGEPGRPRVDLVCGGFPCQPVSVAGRRQAQEDPRWLWPAFAAVVRDLRPRCVLVENVPGLLAHGMGDVLGDLAGLGYDAEWDRVPAAFVGAPHLRGRIFVVATDTLERAHLDSVPPSGEWPLSRGNEPSIGPMADTGGLRRGQGSRELGGMGTAQRRPAVADADQQRRDRRPRIFREAGWGQPTHRGQWSPEPDVGRVAHGVPNRVDRLRALGNAVVPQVAEHIGRLIMDAERSVA